MSCLCPESNQNSEGPLSFSGGEALCLQGLLIQNHTLTVANELLGWLQTGYQEVMAGLATILQLMLQEHRSFQRRKRGAGGEANILPVRLQAF